jgi:hypothetical protein
VVEKYVDTVICFYGEIPWGVTTSASAAARSSSAPPPLSSIMKWRWRRRRPSSSRCARATVLRPVLAVERAVALANRHRRLPRVAPHGSEAIRFGIEAGDSCAGPLPSVRIADREIRLQQLTVLDHVLLTRAFRHDRLSRHREERHDDVPVARKLSEQPLTGTRSVRRLVLIVGLLRYRRSDNEHRRGNPFLHGTQTICEKREPCTPYSACQSN